MREELADVLRTHQAAPVPSGIDRRGVIDAELPSASILGWATLVLAGVPLTERERAAVMELAESSFSLIGLMPVHARPYFARLGLIAALTAALAATALTEP